MSVKIRGGRPMSTCVLVDIDSTLSDSRQRKHLVNAVDRSKTDWVAYSMACFDDPPIDGPVYLVRELARLHLVVLLSGRAEEAEQLTVDWMDMNKVPFDRLILRPASDKRANHTFKADWAKQLRSEGLKPVLCIDDWPPVAQAMASLGIPTVLVTPPFTDQDIHTMEGFDAYNAPHRDLV